ncbi:hypothetical protein ACIU3K_003694 [Salmonella enterica subsp. enterica serovar Apapa]
MKSVLLTSRQRSITVPDVTLAPEGAGICLPKLNARALMPDDLVIVESAPEKIDTFSCKMTVPPSGHHNGFFFCTY